MHGEDVKLNSVDLDFVQTLAEGGAKLGGNPAGPPVREQAVTVNHAEVPTGGYVPGFEGHVDAQCFQGAAADHVFQRVVTEQSQVTRSATGRDSGQNRRRKAASALLGHGVQVGDMGCFQFRKTRIGMRQSSQSVHN